jgi:hypothetical protein
MNNQKYLMPCNGLIFQIINESKCYYTIRWYESNYKTGTSAIEYKNKIMIRTNLNIHFFDMNKYHDKKEFKKTFTDEYIKIELNDKDTYKIENKKIVNVKVYDKIYNNNKLNEYCINENKKYNILYKIIDDVKDSMDCKLKILNNTIEIKTEYIINEIEKLEPDLKQRLKLYFKLKLKL